MTAGTPGGSEGLHRNVIACNRYYLQHHLVASEALWSQLLDKKVLPKAAISDIKSHKNATKQVDRLLDLLTIDGPGAFCRFCAVLQASGHSNVADRLLVIEAANQLRQGDVANFGELVERLLNSVHSTSAATQQIAQRELKSSLLQHKQELESQIVGLKSEVGNLRELLVSCLLTGETLASCIQKGAALSRECLIVEQKHLEKLKLLTLSVAGMETEVQRYYDNMQSLLLYIRQDVDDKQNNNKTLTINGTISSDVSTAKPRKVESLSPGSQTSNGSDKKFPIKHVHFASDRSNCSYGKVWVNPAMTSSNGTAKSSRDVVFAEDLPGPAKVQLDDDILSSLGEMSSVTTSLVEPSWPSGRSQMPLATLDAYDFGDSSGSLSRQTGQIAGKSQFFPRWTGDMRVLTPRLSAGGSTNSVTRMSYPPISGEKMVESRSKVIQTQDRKYSASLRVKPDSSRQVITADHCGTMETVLPRFRPPIHRANSERSPSVFDRSKRQHSISPRVGAIGAELIRGDQVASPRVTVIQLGGSIKSPNRTSAPVSPSLVQNTREKLVRKPSASLHKVVLTLNEDHAVPMSSRSSRDIVAPSRGSVRSSRQGRLS